jgi:hypothetical protein
MSVVNKTTRNVRLVMIIKNIKQAHLQLRNWVKQTQKPLRQLHHIEQAAVNDGFVNTHKRVRPEAAGNVEYKPVHPEIACLYQGSRELTSRGNLPHRNSGIMWYTPNDMPKAFKPIVVSSRRKRSTHKLYNLPYTLTWGELNDSNCYINGKEKYQIIPKHPVVVRRARQLSQLNNKAKSLFSAGTPVAGVVASALTGQNVLDIVSYGFMGIPVGIGMATVSTVVLPKVFTAVRHAAERTAFNAVSLVAFPKKTLKSLFVK